MKTAVLTYHDDRRQEVANLSMPNIAAFAANNGFEHVNCYQPNFDRPFMQKVHLLEEYIGQYDRVLYCDLDVLFTPGAKADKLFCKDINCSLDSQGFNTGFMTFRNTPQVRRVVQIWSQLGLMRFARYREQDTFQWLEYSFKWIHDLTYSIPTGVVANRQNFWAGEVAYHFWCHHDPANCIQRMREALKGLTPVVKP